MGGPVDGKQVPVEISLTVHGVVADAGPAGALILLAVDLTDPDIATIGSIAAGMSGSPVLVEDDGEDKVVGALSYGDVFTTGGLGLATPIEDMLSVEAAGLAAASATGWAGRVTPIPPISVAGRTISRIEVSAPGPAARTGAVRGSASDASTARFVPLLAMQIGGLPAGSRAYGRLAAGVVEHGLRVSTPRGSGVGGQADGFRTGLVPGAAVGTFYSLGDFSYGAVGTVTYTAAGGGVVAFGHPLMWTGRTGAFLTNAWIDGVWSSSLESYKLGSPGEVRGTLTQDRAAGVGGTLTGAPAGVPVTASATVTADGRTTTRTASTSVAPVSFTMWFRSDLPAAAVAQPGTAAADAAALPGSATTTLRISVSDGAQTRTVERHNVFDDGTDVLWTPGGETYDTLEALLDDPQGTAHVTVTGVDMTTTITTRRALGEITGIASPGLRTGRNTVYVTLRRYGPAKPVRVPVTLTIPDGTPTQGTVTAASGQGAIWDRRDTTSAAALVSSLNRAPSGADVVVDFQPEDTSLAAIRGVARTSYAIQGEAQATTSTLSVLASPARITAGRAVTLRGTVAGASESDTVRVQRRTRGTPTWHTVRSAVPLQGGGDGAAFSVRDRPQYNCVYRVSYAGSATVLGSRADVGVAVRGRVTLTGARAKGGFTLRARVAPHRAGSRITFEHRTGNRWRTIKSVTTDAQGRASSTWRVPPGTYQVRARLKGTPDLSANTSRTVTLTRTR